MMVALRSLNPEDDVEPWEYVPPGHGEPGPPLDGRGSHVQEAWEFDPTPIPAPPTTEVDF